MPRLRAARTQEDIGKAAPDEPLDIELEAAPVEEEIETQPLEPGPNKQAEHRWVAAEGTLAEPKPEPKVEEPEVDLRKRLADVERAEAENTRLRQERADLERQLQEAQRAQSRSQDERNDAYYAGLLNAKDAAEAQAQMANQAIRAARANADEDAEDVARRNLMKAEVALSRYEDQIGEYEEIRKQPKVEVQQPQPQGLEAAIAQYPEEAKQRFRAHPEYVTVPRMTAKLVAAHWDAIEEGHAQYSPGYFKYLDENVFEPVKLTVVEGEQRLYTTVAPEQREQVRRGVVASAPPTRDVPSASTGRPQSTRVTLSAEEREIARMGKSKHQTLAEAELEYARQKIKYQEAKRAGQYQERG